MVVAAALCGVGLVATVLAVVRLGGRDTVTTAQSPPAGAARAGGIHGERADEIADRVNAEVFAYAASTSLPDADALAADAGSILRAWLGGTRDDYLAYLAASGDMPSAPAVWADPERGNKAWLDATGPLRGSIFYLDGVSVQASVVDGVAKLDEPPRSTLTKWRFDKLSGVDDAVFSTEQIKAARMNIHEVRIPMRSKGIVSNTVFDGLLVLSYTRDPRTSQWTLISVSICDFPNGETSRIPSF